MALQNKKIKFGGKMKGKAHLSQLTKITYGKEPNLEQDAEIELTELQKDFKKAAKQEEALKQSNVDSEFFSVIIFKSNQQMTDFYKQLGIVNTDLQYISGERLAQALQIQIAKIELQNPGMFKVNKEIANLVMSLD